VWNSNAVVGIVGCFNLQGSSWDRSRRKFHIHDKRGVTLDATVRPNDIEPFRSLAAAAAAAAAGSGSASSNGSGESRWAGAATAAGVDTTAAAEAGSSNGTPVQEQQQRQQQFAVYRYGTEEVRVCSAAEGVAVQLGKAGSDLVWISPLQQQAGISFAPLGLVEMFNGGGSVQSYAMQPRQQRPAAVAAVADGPAAVAAMQVRGCGRFLAYSSAKPKAVLLNLTPHNFSWDEYTCRLEFEVPQHSEDLMCEVEVLFE
jgi:raffinose synthase